MKLKLLPGITKGSLYSVIFLFVFTVLLAGANLAFTARQVNTARNAARAQCAFDYDLAGLPLSVNPKTGKASLLGVRIIADSRMAWRGLDCPGHLPPPSASFTKWARYYHLPAG